MRIDTCLYDLECMFQNYRDTIVLMYVINSITIIEHILRIEFIGQDNIEKGFVLLGDRPPTIRPVLPHLDKERGSGARHHMGIRAKVV